LKTAFFFLFNCTIWLAACSQQAVTPDPVIRHVVPLGSSAVVIEQTRLTDSLPYFFVHLHDNETTAAEIAKQVAAREGIMLIRILNQRERLIRFQQSGGQLQVDPNRIFSDTGIRKTLALYNRYSEEAFRAVQQFRNRLLQLLDHNKTIIALHNNTDNRFSILHYQEAGNLPMHVNAEHDPDDFFLTNNRELFDLLRAANFNVVLEEASRVDEDGSLSLYCSRKNIRYINVEAEHGHQQQQAAMLDALLRILN
jgi:hypothetical protein